MLLTLFAFLLLSITTNSGLLAICRTAGARFAVILPGIAFLAILKLAVTADGTDLAVLGATTVGLTVIGAEVTCASNVSYLLLM